MTVAAGHWMGGARTLIRTRPGRRAQDPGAVLRALARGADDAVGINLRGVGGIRGLRILLVLSPELAGQLLAGHAAHVLKGPGTERLRPRLGNGLLTSEGAEHRRARRLVAPIFSPRRLAAYTDTFTRCALASSAAWHDGETVDMHRELAALTLQIVGQTLLGVDLSTQAPQVREGMEAAMSDIGTDGFVLPTRVLPTRRRRAEPVLSAAEQAVDQLIRGIIADRRRSPEPAGTDVISTLLADSGPDGLTPDEVRDHVVTLVTAGHETTANALTWTLHLLGEHPEVQRRLQAEVDTLGGRLPGIDDVPALPYTRAVVSEAIRLCPPAWVLGRLTTAPLDLGRWHLPAQSHVVISPLLLHHDPRWFADPEAFDPDRWLDGRQDAVPRYAYLPFGTGPRACIGEQFAWLEAVTVLAVLAARWTARTVPGHPVRFQYRVTLRPAGGLPMTLHARR